MSELISAKIIQEQSAVSMCLLFTFALKVCVCVCVIVGVSVSSAAFSRQATPGKRTAAPPRTRTHGRCPRAPRLLCALLRPRASSPLSTVRI